MQPTRKHRAGRSLRPCDRLGRNAPCLALLRMGFAEPRRSPIALVSSYLTVSPSPVPRGAIGGLFSVALSTGRPAWVLPSILPYGVRTFLDASRRRGRP